MFELANYLVGIYKVSDCTDSITLLNHPPQLATQQPTVASNVTLDDTLRPENDEDKEPESQARPSEVENPPEKETGGRETTFAPPMDSTGINETQTQPRPTTTSLGPGRETTFLPPVESTAIDAATPTPRPSVDISLQSPPSSPDPVQT